MYFIFVRIIKLKYFYLFKIFSNFQRLINIYFENVYLLYFNILIIILILHKIIIQYKEVYHALKIYVVIEIYLIDY